MASDQFKHPGQVAEEHFNRAYAAREHDSMPKVPRWDDAPPEHWSCIMTQNTEVKEVVRFETPDGVVHGSRAAANDHLRLINMRAELVKFAVSVHIQNMSSDEIAEMLEVHRVRILEIYAQGLQVLPTTSGPKGDVLPPGPQGPANPAEHLLVGDYSKLNNLDVVTTMLNSCERMTMIGGFTGSEGYQRNRRVMETCKAELLRRLASSAYM